MSAFPPTPSTPNTHSLTDRVPLCVSQLKVEVFWGSTEDTRWKEPHQKLWGCFLHQKEFYCHLVAEEIWVVTRPRGQDGVRAGTRQWEAGISCSSLLWFLSGLSFQAESLLAPIVFIWDTPPFPPPSCLHSLDQVTADWGKDPLLYLN